MQGTGVASSTDYERKMVSDSDPDRSEGKGRVPATATGRRQVHSSPFVQRQDRMFCIMCPSCEIVHLSIVHLSIFLNTEKDSRVCASASFHGPAFDHRCRCELSKPPQPCPRTALRSSCKPMETSTPWAESAPALSWQWRPASSSSLPAGTAQESLTCWRMRAAWAVGATGLPGNPNALQIVIRATGVNCFNAARVQLPESIHNIAAHCSRHACTPPPATSCVGESRACARSIPISAGRSATRSP